ncbi:MAG: FolC bifunctional protein [Solirubrobacterales bacterium]|jgi:dihydrofolate synthase/folylpolyglutamate synthase|nr:FolC bifunctional protein [Solirubrobacterales bacterium]
MSTTKSSGGSRWSERRAEQHLRSLELFGMRFGLDRMRRMMTVLGSPQSRYECIHVLGTNGKTSTTRMTAAILQRHGLSTAAFTSPHLASYRERLQIDEREIDGEELAEAIARAASAAERVNRTLAEDDHVTQFELLTAAALWAIAQREVDVAVIEAGLGGRYDATSVIDARVTALTNVGLEHTRWLGPTVRDIAEEKLAVVAERSTLALGAQLDADALVVAERVAGERGARLLRASERASAPELLAGGDFQQRNFALAELVATTFLREVGVEPRADAIAAAARTTDVRGRLQVVTRDPLTVLDGAHNPHAARALASSLPALVAGRPLALVLGVLEDKDAVGMLQALLGLCERAWFTAPPSPRALSPAALQSLARQLGFERVECEPSPQRALAQAQQWARGRGEGAVVATGSVYLVGALLAQIDAAEEARSAPREPGARQESSGSRRRAAS